MVHVTKSNFLTQLTDFLQHLPDASFIALDEEMTGISLPGSRNQRPNKIELPNERYTRLLKGVPERYSILQVGVALFHKNPRYKKSVVFDGFGSVRDRSLSTSSYRSLTAGVGNPNNDEAGEDEHAFMHREGMLNQDELEDVTEREEEEELMAAAAAAEDNENSSTNGDNKEEDPPAEEPEYTSRIYNFYLFPNGNSPAHEREVTMNPSTVKFLLDNHMDFDKVFREGISYTTVENAEYKKKRYCDKYIPKKESAEKEGGDEERKKENGNGMKESGTPRKNRVKLTRVEDIAFVARTMADLREWIDADNSPTDPLANVAIAAAAAGAAGQDVAAAVAAAMDGNDGNGADNGTDNDGPDEEGMSLVLPPCNAFLRRCLYETIEDEYPTLILERADLNALPGGPPATRNQIRVIRLSPAEKKRREDRLRHDAWDRLLQDIGFTTLFQAISDACNGKVFTKESISDFIDGKSTQVSAVQPAVEGGEAKGKRIPLVIHNGLMDLMFLLTHCHDKTLPESFEDTKKIIHQYFPLVYDTKVFGTEYSDAIIRGGSTTLGDLFDNTCKFAESEQDFTPFKMPPIMNQDGRSQGQAHEAAWDAYMTGCVFNALSNRMFQSDNVFNSSMTLGNLLNDLHDNLLREWAGVNLIYMHASLYTIDLESSSGPAVLNDCLSKGLSIDTTFHVSGITTSVSTRDILQALTAGGESEEDDDIRLLKYEIIWIDDISFFVGTRMDENTCTTDAATTGLVASHVRNKLHSGLGDVEITSLGDYFIKKYKGDEDVSEGAGIVGSLVSVASMPFKIMGSVLGLGRKKRSSGDSGESDGPNKRRRLG